MRFNNCWEGMERLSFIAFHSEQCEAATFALGRRNLSCLGIRFRDIRSARFASMVPTMSFRSILFAAALVIFSPSTFTRAQAPASQPESPAATPATTQLEPLVISSGKLSGDVVLSIDVDGKGAVSKITSVSGPADLIPKATQVARMFRHPEFPGTSGLIQRIHFPDKSEKITKVAPIYPPIARAAHQQGTVEVIASVASDGHISEVLAAVGAPMLQGAARDAIRQWVLTPLQQNGIPLACTAVIDVDFKL